MKPSSIISLLRRDAQRAERDRITKTYVFVFVPVFIDRGAHAFCAPFAAPSPQTPNGVRARPEQRALPGKLPFWTWFIDNPRSVDS